MMMTEKTSLMTNAPVVNGEFVNPEDKVAYARLLEMARKMNAAREKRECVYSEFEHYYGDKVVTLVYKKNFVIRKRYRGPRAKTRRNRQSMCLKSEATHVSVYLFDENKRVA